MIESNAGMREAIVAEWTETKTVTEVVDELNKVEVPCSSVSTFDETVNDPQILSRDMVIEVEQLVLGSLKVPDSTFKLSKTPGDTSSPAPFLRQHNYEVYSNLLGFSEQGIKSFRMTESSEA